MADPHVLTALIAKYGRLSGQLVACEQEARNIEADLAKLDAVIKLFRADFDVGSIPLKRQYKQNRTFTRGAMVRTALDILRESDKPLSSRELALLALHRQGISNADNALVQLVRNSLTNCLAKKEKVGSVAGGGYPKRWSIPKA